MNRFSKLFGFIVVFVAIMAAFCTVSFAATVGQSLKSPEAGWMRIDDNDTLIKYSGSFLRYDYDTSFYKGTGMRIAYSNKSGNAEFKFYGTKVRIISYCDNPIVGHSSEVQVKIDNTIIGTYSAITGGPITNFLAIEKTGLSLGVHKVEITPLDSSKLGTLLDAIDIDDTGFLVDLNTPYAPSNLTAVSGNSKVDLSWTATTTTGSAIYNIKRSTTSGSGVTIATTSAITYSDTSVTNGTTYYYVITAVVNGVESPDSNKASATPTEPIVPQPTNQLKLVLEVKEEKQLSVSVELSDNTEMDWTSSDSTAATVDANGKLKALKPGNTIITCTSKDKSYTESINILVVDLVYQLAVDLTVGGACRLTIDDLANTTNVTWSSYDPTIATVSAKGKVTAVTEGLTYIVATDKDGKEIGRIYIRVR